MQHESPLVKILLRHRFAVRPLRGAACRLPAPRCRAQGAEQMACVARRGGTVTLILWLGKEDDMAFLVQGLTVEDMLECRLGH